mmetsp:Transcript_14869/g.29205  ORF Transcript_14869/g.29205 Transcript_14869/m.29205 type:complete len:134 (+) Transcript_14869:105-506(+)
MKRPVSTGNGSRNLHRSYGDVSARKPRPSFFKDIFGRKGPDPQIVAEWLPPFVASEKIQLEFASIIQLEKGIIMKFAVGKFDELGFFHSQLDEIPDSEAKKPKESHLRAIERDREFAKKVLRSIQSQFAHPRR